MQAGNAVEVSDIPSHKGRAMRPNDRADPEVGVSEAFPVAFQSSFQDAEKLCCDRIKAKDREGLEEVRDKFSIGDRITRFGRAVKELARRDPGRGNMI